ncbi:MAG: response regulator [Candidatus Methanoperedens sp.]|nr:response regulator [Candidatus Methanoperedens sp.]MCZ7371558.1 response regulator [Candidatus Methanoperedens sp.]
MVKTRILVVEDEVIVAEDIRRSLQSLGYDVPAIESYGPEAIEKAEKYRPDLVLMDIMLRGEMDGIQAATQIHSRFDIPVVYLTAYSDEKILERAKITDPFGYIIKPFKERELKINIEIALYKHNMEMQLRKSREFYESVLEGIITGVWVTDSSDVIVYANKGMEAIGITPLQIVGSTDVDFLKFVKPYYLKARETLQPFSYEAVPFVSAKAGTKYYSGWFIPRIKDGKFNGMICTIENISKQTQVEKN